MLLGCEDSEIVDTQSPASEAKAGFAPPVERKRSAPNGGKKVQYPFSVVLASGSPRRLQLLQRMGLDVVVAPADVDESRRAGEGAQQLVRRLAATKAVAVAPSFPASVVLAGDTVVALGSSVLGKPTDADDAVAILTRLSGKRHQVYTGVSAYRADNGRGFVHVDIAQVTFRSLSATEIVQYVDSGEPMDKAGAYAIQGGAGPWIETFEGNLETVIGLPTDQVEIFLRRFSDNT